MPFRRCAACNTSKRSSKRISCLHSLCVACLGQFVQPDGSVKCPDCGTGTPCRPGLSLFQSLPNSVSTQDNGVDVLCDECVDDQPATGHCLDCKTNLCHGHAAFHPKTRSTRDHRVASLAEQRDSVSGAAPGTGTDASRKCGLHPTQTVQQFCRDCRHLLCQACLEIGTREHDGHKVLPVVDAAKVVRDSLNDDLETCESAIDGLITAAMDKVRSSIRNLNDQTETASELAKEFYGTLSQSITKRQNQILNELDHLRTKKLLLLEKQLTSLESGLSRAESALEILRSTTDTVDMLLLGSWVGDAISSAKETVDSQAEHCVASGLLFSPTDTSSILKGIETAGRTLDVADGHLKCSETAVVGEEVTIQFEVSSDDASLQLSISELEKSGLEIRVNDASDQLSLCTLATRPGGTHTQAKYQPTNPGRHVVSASVAGVVLPGTRVDVDVTAAVSYATAPRDLSEHTAQGTAQAQVLSSDGELETDEEYMYTDSDDN